LYKGSLAALFLFVSRKSSDAGFAGDVSFQGKSVSRVLYGKKPWLSSISNLHCCKSPATRRRTCRAGMDSGWSRSAYGVASNRVYICTQLPVVPVSSYLAFPSLPQNAAVYFCCTFPEVTLGGRYPLSCPVKPGLSSR